MTETTAGPWGIEDWRITKPVMPRDPREQIGVAVIVVNRVTGEQKCQGVRIVLNERSGDEAEVRARVAQAKNLLRSWVGDLNAAEREEQPA